MSDFEMVLCGILAMALVLLYQNIREYHRRK